MSCPYCHSKLQETQVGTKDGQLQTIHECFTCGGHWFPRWIANEITLDTAQTTDAILTNQSITPPKEPRCPQCDTRLSAIKSDAIPQGVTVWACPNGHGNFFPKGELYKFKKAQEIKISYRQLWGISTKSVLAVLLPVLVVLSIAAGLPLTLKQLQTSQESRTKASGTYTTPLLNRVSDTSVILSFSTSAPAQTSLTLYQDSQFKNTQPISVNARTSHNLTLKDLLPGHTYTYTLTITFGTDNTQTTPQTLIDLDSLPLPSGH